MSNKQILIAVMKFKADLIKKFTDIDLLVEDDFKEIETWDEETCRKIIVRIRAAKERNDETDILICPWCLRFMDLEEECLDCNYKERHGWCLNKSETSTYQRITGKTGTSIVGIQGLLPGIYNIIKEGSLKN
jgi:hypothetical protein